MRRFVDIQPVLDYHALQPGGKATKAIRATIASLGLTPENGVRVRLTGSVPVDDDEFATVADGAGLNAAITIVVVLVILWLALKQVRMIAAVLVNLAVGLVFTAAIGLWMVGTLNLISVAFAVLFVGLGVDFGIQFSVRCRAERFKEHDLRQAIEATARGVAGPLLLAAASIAAAFYSFLPTAYVGLSELGLIAGTGMVIAFATTVTLLPALLAALKPLGEVAPVGFAALAPLDHFLERRRNWVVGLTLAAVILGLPLLRDLRFDFNPLNLRSKQVESISTLLDLMRDPDTSPNTIDILEPDFAQATKVAKALEDLPEVAHARTLENFIPKDQDDKLALIDDASFFYQNTMTPDALKPSPSPAETLEAIDKTAGELSSVAAGVDTPAAIQSRRLAGALTGLAKASPAATQDVERVLVTPLLTTLQQVRDLFSAEAVTLELPARRPQERLGRVRRRSENRGWAEGRRQRQHGPAPLRRGGPQSRAAGERDADFHRRGSGDHREGVSSGGGVVARVHRVYSLRRSASLDGCGADPRAAAGRDCRHPRDLRDDWPAAQLRQHYRAAPPAWGRSRVQDLLRHGVAIGREKLSAVAADAGGSVQRLHHGDRVRQSLVLPSSRNVEHGEADGFVAGDDSLRGCAVPAGASGDPGQARPKGVIRVQSGHGVAKQ